MLNFLSSDMEVIMLDFLELIIMFVMFLGVVIGFCILKELYDRRQALKIWRAKIAAENREYLWILRSAFQPAQTPPPKSTLVDPRGEFLMVDYGAKRSPEGLGWVYTKCPLTLRVPYPESETLQVYKIPEGVRMKMEEDGKLCIEKYTLECFYRAISNHYKI